MSERRYTEDEVATIFRAAAEQQTALGSATRAPLPTSQGMTLAQLQEIGREVGIPADLVAGAAQALDRVGKSSIRKFLGLPLGVGRTVSLGRRLSDAEWEQLVVDLRETFDARGRLREEGSFRQWTNGNLQALLEPTATGHQLRLRTLKGDSYALMTSGLAAAAVGAIAMVFEGAASGTWGIIPALVGAGMFALGALRLPGWARLRRQQMEEIATRLADTTRS